MLFDSDMTSPPLHPLVVHAVVIFLTVVPLLVLVSLVWRGLRDRLDWLLPVAALVGFVVLSAAYFIMNFIFYGSGVVSIIIELVGGTVFLIVILKKGRL